MKTTDAHFNGIRRSIKTQHSLKELYKLEFFMPDQDDPGGLLIRHAADCMFLLDRLMHILWQKLANPKRKNSYIYFPVYEREKDFIDKIEDYKLKNIESCHLEIFNLIKNVQPFYCGHSWLFKQYQIAKQRHSEPERAYPYKPKNGRMRIGFNLPVGESVSMRVTQGNRTEYFSLEKWGIPIQDPPKYFIKNQGEAMEFFEICLSETSALIYSVINYFEKDL